MGNQAEYTSLPTDVERAPTPQNTLNEAELLMLRRSSRWVILLCFIQLLMALATLLHGGIIMMCVSALFITFGIVGAAKQRVRLLTVHFVYSLILYVLSLICVVLMILNCNGCYWGIYVAGFFTILFQAIGMRHSRRMICLLKKQSGNVCAWKCKSEEVTPKPQVSEQNIQLQSMPAHQVVAMQMQPRFSPQYFPMQSVQYPMMQQPINLTPYSFQIQPQVQSQVESTQSEGVQAQQPIGLFPVVYRQF